MRQTRFILGLIAAAAFAACGGGGSGGGYPSAPNTGNPGGSNPGGTGATGNTVTLSDGSFLPGTLTVPSGTTVTWQWASCSDTSGGYGGGYATCVSHNVLFDDGVSSGVQSQGTFTRTFASKGTFKYHCVIHGQAMAGQVTVQ